MTDKERLAQLEAELAQYKAQVQTAPKATAAAPAPAPSAYKAPAPTPIPVAPAPTANHGYTPGGNVNQSYQQYLSMLNAQPGAYTPGENVNASYQQYMNMFNAQPGAYQSQWLPQMEGIYNQLQNRPDFKYDMNADTLYQQLKDQYIRSGQLGMMNTMGQASAMTGGYGNTYAQTAGQQTFDSYMQELNNNLPALSDRAYAQYQDKGNQLAQQFGMAGQMEGIDYGKYRDAMGDWQWGTGTALDQYNQERGFDYGQYRDQVGDWQWGTGTALGQYNQEYGNDYGAFADKRSADFAREQFEWEKAWNQQQFDYQKQMDEQARADALAAQAAAAAGGGGGRGTGGTGKDVSKAHEYQASQIAQNQGDAGVVRYLDQLQAEGYNREQLKELYKTVNKVVSASQPRTGGIGR